MAATTATKQPLTFSTDLTEDDKKRLFDIFSADGPPATDRWASLWDAGDFLPWDRGMPNPAIIDAFRDRSDILGTSPLITDPITGQQRRKRALVPGCGRGYDVLFFASLGYDAYGLEVSTKAVELCRDFARDYGHQYPVKDAKVGAGTATFIHGDFFNGDWLDQVDGGQTFELFYDYTFLCALDPSMRTSWSRRYFDLATKHSDSRVVCLEFPTDRDPTLGGPPWALPPPVYVAHLGNPGLAQPYDSRGHLIESEVVNDANSEGFKRIGHWQPERTHSIGIGKDQMSVWQLKKE